MSGKEKSPKTEVIPEHSLKAAAFPETRGVITATVIKKMPTNWKN